MPLPKDYQIKNEYPHLIPDSRPLPEGCLPTEAEENAILNMDALPPERRRDVSPEQFLRENTEWAKTIRFGF